MALDADEQLQFQREVAEYLRGISIRCKQILQEEIYLKVYNAYNPKEYERNYQLLESINIDIQTDGSIRLFFDDVLYWSNVDFSDQSEHVPFYVNYGHKDDSGIHNMYHDYGGRRFMESAARRIRAEFGVRVAIIKDRTIEYIE